MARGVTEGTRRKRTAARTRSKRLSTISVVLALLLVTGVLVALAGSGPPADPTVADDLLALVEKGRSQTYHARYVVRSEPPAGGEPQFSIETWRKPPQVRRDTTVQSPSSTMQTAGFARGTRVERCERTNQDPWECQDATENERATFDSLVEDLAAEVEGARVTVQRDRRKGTDLDCYTIHRPSDTATEYCFDLDGIPFSVSNGTSRLERLELTRGFPNQVFTSPAKAGGPPQSEPIVETVTLPMITETLALHVAGELPTALQVPAPGAIIIPCADGGSSSHHHHTDQELPQGAFFTNLRTLWRSNVDLHTDGPAADGFLQPDQSNIALTNQRGSMRLALEAGACGNPAISWDGTTASGGGTWAVDPLGTADAYRDASGSGSFTFIGDFAPGDLNPWSVELDGTLAVLPPGVSAELVRSYWGHLGADYAGRIVTVVLRLSNPGPGDAFSVRLLEPDGPIGFTPVEYRPQVLGDWVPDDSIDVTLRFRVGLDQPSDHKGPLVLRRTFDIVVRVQLLDALDRVRPVDIPITVTTPSFPPPL